MNKTTRYQLIITLIAGLLFIPFLGQVHLFDWDEINFAESAREMIVTGDYLNVQINFDTFWEKPPLFTWFQVLSMKIFGINEFAARFPNAIAGIITLLVLFNIGRKLYNERLALIWILAYAGSILPHFYFKSGIIDPWFNLFIFLGIYYFYLFSRDSGTKLTYVLLSATAIGLGILTKGPVAFLLFFITAVVYMILNGAYKKFLNVKVIATYIATLSLVGGFWFILQILNGNYDILVKFIAYQIRLFTIEDAGHGGFLLYHFVILFFGVFPASIFMLKSFKKESDDSYEYRSFKQWMIILFWVVLIIFTIVNTKIVHYSSMCYFPMSFLAAYIINKIVEGKQPFERWMKITLSIIASILGLAIATLQLITTHKDLVIKSGMIKDNFTIGNLEANSHWLGFEFITGIVLLLGVLLSILFLKKEKNQIIGVFISSLIFVNSSIVLIVPRIEEYSQNTAIEFYKEIAKEECYLTTFHFKSYAIYYYFDLQPESNKNYRNKKWLYRGNIDKPVYVVCKNTSHKKFEQRYPLFRKVKEKNGFVFYFRDKKK
ncbi:MAG: glycosyl transferase [Bacteroidetes bacterium]|nr:MAG: glycosyl transferase [Bacteroidota bacterium]PIE87961.1 MAG: glycosyl transferase [Bacteroidota bacterium]